MHQEYHKVRGADTETIRRNSLTKFHRYIEIENPNKICFISDTPLNSENLSIHHVIPWSYMFSDDLWNLVYVKKMKIQEYQIQFQIKG